jgi:apolipoprotein N-acyltransferase
MGNDGVVFKRSGKDRTAKGSASSDTASTKNLMHRERDLSSGALPTRLLLVFLAFISGPLTFLHPCAYLLPLVFLTSVWAARPNGFSRTVVTAYAGGCAILVIQPIEDVLGPGNFHKQLLGWALMTATTALPWLLISGTGIRRVISGGVVGMLTLLPPFGTLAAPSPHMALGYVFPGSGAFANILLIISIAVFPGLNRRHQIGWFFGLTIISLTCHELYKPPAPPTTWQAIRTHFIDQPDDALASRHTRMQWLLKDATQRLMGGTKLAIYPETVLGNMQPGLVPQLALLEARAKRFEATLLIGLSAQTPSGLENRLVFLGTETGYYRARQPVPLILWNLWSQTGYDAHWADKGVYNLRGKRAALLICWEEWTPWTMLRSAFERPEIILSASNHGWARRGRYMWKKQTLGAKALEMQYGLPMLRAINLPS